MPAASSGASSPLSAASTASLRTAVIRTLMLTEPSPRASRATRPASRSQPARREFIQKAQLLGFSLNEIRELFSIQRHPHGVCVHVRDLIEQKLAVIREKIVELQRLESQLSGSLRQCRTALRHPLKHHDCCPVLEAITKPAP